MRKLRNWRLALESLEERLAPAAFGVPWPDASHLTLSFAPDGTQVGDQSSELFRLLDGAFPGSHWQNEILRAAQTWAVQANLNLGLVPDEGAPFGLRGPRQGDSRAGDLRVAAVPMSPEVIGIGSPYDLLAGTWAGDVRLNSHYQFGQANTAEQVDLFSVVLHELGHALGLDHDHDDPDSAMYDLVGTRTGLAARDIAALRALYGPREADEFDLASRFGNDTFPHATWLNLGNDPYTVVEGDLTTLTDVDVYEFRPGQTDTVTVRLRTAGLSLLNPRLSVFDQFKTLVATVTGAGPAGDKLTVTLPNVRRNDTFYVQVQSAASDLFGIGGYRLEVERDLSASHANALAGWIADLRSRLRNDDQHTNDTLATATFLQQKVFVTDSRWDYVYAGSLSDAQDVDFYRLKAPKAAAGAPNVLSVSLWGTGSDLDLRAAVYDVLGRPVAAEVLVNDGHTFTLQVANAVSNAHYYLRVSAAVGSSTTQRNYLLAADFSAHPVELPPLVAGALDAVHPQETFTLTISESQLYHFVLAAGAPDGVPPLRMTVDDGQGDVQVVTLSADGSPTSATTFLAPGTYRFRFEGGRGQPFAPFLYTLYGVSLSDPIGPQLADTTGAPAGPTPAAPAGGGVAAAAPPTPTFVSVQEAYNDPVLPIQTGQVAGPAGGAVVPDPTRLAGLVTGPAPLTTLPTPAAPAPAAPTASAEIARPAPPAGGVPSPSTPVSVPTPRADGVRPPTPPETPAVPAARNVTTAGPVLVSPSGREVSRALAAQDRPEGERGTGLSVAARAPVRPGEVRVAAPEPTRRPGGEPTPAHPRRATEEEAPGQGGHAGPPPAGKPFAPGQTRPASQALDAERAPPAEAVPPSPPAAGAEPVPDAAPTDFWSSLWRALATLLTAPLALWAFQQRGFAPRAVRGRCSPAAGDSQDKSGSPTAVGHDGPPGVPRLRRAASP